MLRRKRARFRVAADRRCRRCLRIGAQTGKRVASKIGISFGDPPHEVEEQRKRPRRRAFMLQRTLSGSKPPVAFGELFMSKSSAKVTIKKYANRRLYDTESSAYITLDRLAQMVREGREFEVIDAKSGEDITRQV